MSTNNLVGIFEVSVVVVLFYPLLELAIIFLFSLNPYILKLTDLFSLDENPEKTISFIFSN
jgi:hypothetical protein